LEKTSGRKSGHNKDETMFEQESFSAQRLIGIAMLAVVFLALSASRLEADQAENSVKTDNVSTEIAARAN
jgi:hypothetical protein